MADSEAGWRNLKSKCKSENFNVYQCHFHCDPSPDRYYLLQFLMKHREHLQYKNKSSFIR